MLGAAIQRKPVKHELLCALSFPFLQTDGKHVEPHPIVTRCSLGYDFEGSAMHKACCVLRQANASHHALQLHGRSRVECRSVPQQFIRKRCLHRRLNIANYAAGPAAALLGITVLFCCGLAASQGLLAFPYTASSDGPSYFDHFSRARPIRGYHKNAGRRFCPCCGSCSLRSSVSEPCWPMRALSTFKQHVEPPPSSAQIVGCRAAGCCKMPGETSASSSTPCGFLGLLVVVERPLVLLAPVLDPRVLVRVGVVVQPLPRWREPVPARRRPTMSRQD